MYQPQVSEKINNFKSEGAKRVEFFKKEISQIKAGRANPNILNKITVDYYGNPSALNQVANISVPEARQIVIAPWDATLVKEIVKAILASDLGITPNDDGKVIRLNFPALTEEKRREIVKELKRDAEEAKVAVRGERRDALNAIKAMEKDKLVTEDELKRIDTDVQRITDGFIADIDNLTADKEKEIMTV